METGAIGPVLSFWTSGPTKGSNGYTSNHNTCGIPPAAWISMQNNKKVNEKMEKMENCFMNDPKYSMEKFGAPRPSRIYSYKCYLIVKFKTAARFIKINRKINTV